MMFRVKLAPMGLYIQPMPSRANVIIAICSNVHLCKPFLAKNLYAGAEWRAETYVLVAMCHCGCRTSSPGRGGQSLRVLPSGCQAQCEMCEMCSAVQLRETLAECLVLPASGTGCCSLLALGLSRSLWRHIN